MRDLKTEKKALFVVRKYLHCKYGREVAIEEADNGADLEVSFDDGHTEFIEVKGTKSTRIAWGKLKVSSRQSFKVLRSGKARMYRVVDVDSPKPRIYILKYDVHYALVPEPRWAVRSVSRRTRDYPLRGSRYRYDRPYDSVAEHEWGPYE